MKTKHILVVALLFSLFSYAGDVTWSGVFTSITQDNVDVIDDWFVGMYSGSFGTINISDLSENLVASSVINVDHSGPVFSWTQGIQATTVSVADNIDVFTVIFNNTDYLFASEYLVIDASAFNVGAAHAPTIPTTYSLGDAAGTWQAIPEPATVLLFGIGGVGAWLIRRNKLKAKEEA